MNNASFLKKVFKTISPFTPKGLKNIIPGRVKNFLRARYVSKTVIIDIVGTCNLKCPSCPNGYFENKNSIGMMSLDVFKKILEKIKREHPGAIVALYNWTEPFLHPQIVEFVKAIRAYGLKPKLSTNLNLLPLNLDEFVSANPGGITISLSGFTQKTYEIAHKGGNIETVKENMLKLISALRKANSPAIATVYYHKYLHNLNEVEPMEKFAKSLGFSFGADWAYFMPIEGVKKYIEGTLPESEVNFIETALALNIKDAVEEAKAFKNEQCLFPSTLLTIDWRGQVQLCCGVYDSNRFSIGSYLDTPSEIIEERLRHHPFCGECVKNGLHVYVSWHGNKEIRPVYEKIAEKQIKNKRGK